MKNRSSFLQPDILFSFVLSTTLILFAVSFFLTTTYAFADSVSTTNTNSSQASKTATGSKNKNPDNRDLSDLIPKATDLKKKQKQMQSELSANNTMIKVKERLRELSTSSEQLQEQLHELFNKRQVNYLHLTTMQEILHEVRSNIQAISTNITQSIATIDKWLDYWDGETTALTKWEKGLGSISDLGPVQSELAEMATTINMSKKILKIELLPLLQTQRDTGKLQVQNYELYLQIQQVFSTKFQYGISKHASSLFSYDYIAQFNQDLWQQTLFSFQSLLTQDTSYIKKEQRTLLLSCLLFFLLLTVLYSHRSPLRTSSHWHFIKKCPVAISFFIALVFFYAISSRMPVFWNSVYRLAVLVSVIRISNFLISDKLQKNFITRLSLLLLLTNLLVMINLTMPLMRLYIILVAVFFLGIYAVQHFQKKDLTRPFWLVWTRRVGAATLVVIISGEISGRADLVFFIFSATLQTLFAVLYVWILYLVLEIISDLILFYTPIPTLQKNSKTITSMIQPMLVIICASTFLGAILVDWHFFSTPTDAINYINDLGIMVADTNISIGLLVSVALLLYIAFCFSKMTQSILLQTILPRKNVDKGVQLSITRLVHYSIMLIGFLLVLQVMGFSLTNLTILGGALGVGIGFGLQAIINNFASGLILLFERPIKVGDTIQLGDKMGEVKELGLRATIVQTFDNAEIVVPNSDLITSQVINWTLKERKTRVKILVGVAYGTDLQKVLKILLNCATERPEVLSTPPATALFVAFGDSSLDFELRVFIPEFGDRRWVQSELAQDIYREFADSGIEIPFPQNDLHIRGVVPAVAKTPVQQDKPLHTKNSVA